MVGGGISDTGSSQRNEQIIREELKRQVIGWLLDEKDFSGRPGLEDPLPSTSKPHAAGFNTPDFTKIRADAPTIQFMEQAFEWGNMMYVF